MATQRQQIGRWGEDAAVEFLLTKGYKIIARNVHTPNGEIDIIAYRDKTTVFVEVKTRTTSAFANPEDSVTQRKQAHLLAAAEYYFDQHGAPDTWQFDVIAVVGRPGGKRKITHYENILA